MKKTENNDDSVQRISQVELVSQQKVMKKKDATQIFSFAKNK